MTNWQSCLQVALEFMPQQYTVSHYLIQMLALSMGYLGVWQYVCACRVQIIYSIQDNQMTYGTDAAMISPLLILKECLWLVKMFHEYIRTSIIKTMMSLPSFRSRNAFIKANRKLESLHTVQLVSYTSKPWPSNIDDNMIYSFKSWKSSSFFPHVHKFCWISPNKHLDFIIVHQELMQKFHEGIVQLIYDGFEMIHRNRREKYSKCKTFQLLSES